MRRLAAIFILLIYLYDLGGYVGIRQLMVYRTDHYFNEQAKKGLYNIDDLTEIKIPFNSTGLAHWDYYARVTGQVQFPNSAFNYVQMKRSKDTLYLMCLPNYDATHLVSHNIIWALNSKDMPVPKKEHVPNVSILFPLCFIFTFHYGALMPPVTGIISNDTPYFQPAVSMYIDIPTQPPESIC